METEKQQAVSTVSEQINSVVDNLADKLEAPASAVTEIAQYGFEAYVWYVFAKGIGHLVTAVLMMAVSACLFYVAKRFWPKNHADEPIGAVLALVFGFILLISSVIPAFWGIVSLIAPEGVAIADVIRSAM
jgi:hypothetical protein